MHDSNPYQAPTAQLHADDVEQLAERGTRLGAVLIDGLIGLAVITPVMWLGGYWSAVIEAAQRGEQVGLGLQAVWMLIGMLIFAAIHAWPLHVGGQTWGKRLLGIRIVTLDGRPVTALRAIFARYFPLQIVGGIPCLGALVVLGSLGMIFRQDRRCGHDFVAGTRVVRAR
ncbi:RDD family protein [Luteimonas terrae]|uniref:RDD family membrane protein YckC n=1 Tax=Luteimonas terrae TaxID=1530191 RepID=A0ABU1Y0E4_9GAMM|nr:RDD family protein [Luteimonas terrae]MDR7193806.1 putative RDD family membrane protein YckC [Luteimonas terrae]